MSLVAADVRRLILFSRTFRVSHSENEIRGKVPPHTAPVEREKLSFVFLDFGWRFGKSTDSSVGSQGRPYESRQGRTKPFCRP